MPAHLDLPAMRPARPFFASGPCAKHPGWDAANLRGALLGRYHRSGPGKARLKAAIDRTRSLLGMPADYVLGIVPASDTGAVEMAMWSMLGPRPVQLLAFDNFGQEWVTDAVGQLKLDAEVIKAPYGELPDLSRVRPDCDLVFPWNGTTSGVRVPDASFISADREGIVICDATSAAFAQPLDWAKLDVVTFSWQKALGGEAGHGMLALSPRAVARLESYTPPWPMPKIFRMTKGGKLMADIFEGATINTPSMLCVEDWLDALRWAEGAGGLSEMMRRADSNLKAVSDWVGRTSWIQFLAADVRFRSNTSACLKIVDPAVAALGDDAQWDFVTRLTGLLEKEGVAFDLSGHRAAPPGLRIWCGATVETDDLLALTPWLDWAFGRTLAEMTAEA